MRLTDDDQSGRTPPNPQPAAPRPVRRRHVVRALLIFLIFFGGAVFAALSSTFAGRKLSAQAMELLGQWPQAVTQPEEIVAHVISLEHKGDLVFPGSFSEKQKRFKASSEEGQAVAALFSAQKVLQAAPSPIACDATGDFALEFVRGMTHRVVVFDLHCKWTDGDSTIHSFDPKAVGAVAAFLFPEEARYRKASLGERIR
jgi:hypothetical protein